MRGEREGKKGTRQEQSPPLGHSGGTIHFMGTKNFKYSFSKFLLSMSNLMGWWTFLPRPHMRVKMAGNMSILAEKKIDMTEGLF